MSGQNHEDITPLEQKLLDIPGPDFGIGWAAFEGISYVNDCGLTKADAPELLDIAVGYRNEAAIQQRVNSTDEFKLYTVPVHAWRALAELKSSAAIEPLLGILNEMCVDDDWVSQDIPYALGEIGSDAFQPLCDFIKNGNNGIESRTMAMDGLVHLGNDDRCEPTVRALIVDFFTELIRQVAEEPAAITDPSTAALLPHVRFATSVVGALYDIKASEAAPLIEKAFSDNQIDIGFVGDWEKVREQLGVEGSGLPMPEKPINLMRRELFGVNVRLLGEHDEPNWEAVDEYCENGLDAFSQSAEGQEVIDRYGFVGWTQSFLELGIRYIGGTVASLKVNDVKEIVFDIIPRKVSVKADRAGEIIFELLKFWEFADRTLGLREAPAVIELLKEDAVEDLKAALSDSSNFGIAKSFFMRGMDSGFDISTQEGMESFMSINNQDLRLDRPEPAEPPMPVSMKKLTTKKRKKLLAKVKKSKKKSRRG